MIFTYAERKDPSRSKWIAWHEDGQVVTYYKAKTQVEAAARLRSVLQNG